MLCVMCYVLCVGDGLGERGCFDEIGEGGWTIYVKLMDKLLQCLL